MARNPHISGLIDKLWPEEEGAPPLSIQIEGNIPTASGLGSSAALSVAFAAALRLGRGRWVTDPNSGGQNAWAEGFGAEVSASNPYNDSPGFFSTVQLTDLHHQVGELAVNADENAILAHGVEAAAQNGRASPMDSSTCSHGSIVVVSDRIESGLNYLYQREMEMPEGKRSWHIHELSLPPNPDEVYLVIGNTGIHAPTGKQVAKVAKMLEQNPSRIDEIETIGKIARRGIKALQDGDYDAVGRTMTENQIMLKSIGVSSPELDALIKAAAPSSLGAKLTGAGGGGCMVALTRNPKKTSDAIELAGGRTLISKIGSLGMQIISSSDETFWTKA